MAVTADQVKVNKTVSVLAQIPPGPCTVVLSNTSGVTVWVGGSTTTSTNGFGIPSGSAPVTFSGWEGSQPATLYAIGTSTAASLGVLISTSH
jgi:hypothetical protein